MRKTIVQTHWDYHSNVCDLETRLTDQNPKESIELRIVYLISFSLDYCYIHYTTSGQVE